MSGLLGDPNLLTQGLARYFTGEQVTGEEAAARSNPDAARTAMAGLLGVAQGIGASGALSPSFSPVRPGFASILTSGLGGGLAGASQAELFNFQAQQQSLQRSAMLREMARRQQVRQFLTGVAAQGFAPAGSGQAPGGPTVATGAPGAPDAAPDAAPDGNQPYLPASLGPDTVAQLPSLAAAPGPLRDIFSTAALEAGLTPEQANVYGRMVQRESGWRHTREDGSILTSRAGARGVAQVMPGTYAGVAQRRSIDGSIDDPVNNMRAGAWYFREMLDRYNGDISRAVGAYNAGPRRMDDYIAGRGQLPQETRAYLTNVTGPASSPRVEGPAVAVAQQAQIPRAVAENVLGLSPQDAMMLLMLNDEDASKAITEILKQRHQGGGYEILTPAQARDLNLPNPDTTRYQRPVGGESRGRISEVGGGSGTRVTIEQRGEDRLQAMDIDAVKAALEQAQAGGQLLPQLRAMQAALLAGTETGPGAAARAAIGNYLVGTGAMSRDQIAQLNNARLFQSLVASVVPAMRPVGSGSTSDRDLALFQQAAPNMLNTSVGNLLITGSMAQIREAQTREARRMEDWLRGSGRGSLAGYRDHAERDPIPAFPSLTNDDAGRRMLAQQAPGTVVRLPGGGLGVVLPNGTVDDGSGRMFDQFLRSRPR